MKTQLSVAWNTVSRARRALLTAKSALGAIADGADEPAEVAAAALEAMHGIEHPKREPRAAPAAAPPKGLPVKGAPTPRRPDPKAPAPPEGAINLRWDAARHVDGATGAWVCVAPDDKGANVLMIHSDDRGWGPLAL